MNEFRFANPEWIHAVWAVLAVAALLVFLELNGRSALDRFLSKAMQPRLAHRTSSTRRLITIGLAMFSLLCLVITMMRPQWGMTVQQMGRADSQIMICLDLSKSMLAEDVAPNRLERAKVELDSLLGLLNDGQQVGLIGFAGKATVMCPMTTDFGFLRLILKEARPESIGLGGTKIGDAIRKAVAGFGEAGDINRLILLITDGEDHDSFPLEVAAEAREKGIRIVAVGFGDEAGSKIEITDPTTGARSFVKDRNGNDVVSRLDGQTLRDIALETEGAYVPAGTGALDLESIYQAHIATLLRGSVESEQRVVRSEAFQWPLLTGLISLVCAFFVGTPFRLRDRAAMNASQWLSSAANTTSVLVIPTMVVLGFSAADARAQDKTDDISLVQEGSDEVSGDTIASTIPAGLSAREAYNQSLQFVGTNPDKAEQLLIQARRDAGADGELRFRALYNLGWVEVNRADALLQEQPEQALLHLEQASSRFLESIRVRPENTEARHNLEIVSRRILELTDSLNKKTPRDLPARLDEMIQQMRDHQVEMKDLIQRTSDKQDSSAHTSEQRRPFRQLGVTQRQIISELQRLAEDARKELDAINAKSGDDLTDQEKLKALQTSNMLEYVDSGLQRMNNARSLTRRLQAVRGFQRWSSALSDVKRARDQLRNPVEIIGQLIGDAAETSNLTRQIESSKSQLMTDPTSARLPPWLTTEYLSDSLQALQQRTAELDQVFAQMLQAQSQTETKDAQQDPEAAATNRMLTNIREAVPFLKTASAAFGQASQQLSADSVSSSRQELDVAIKSLTEAWELFFDIRRMIEAIFRDEQVINRALEAAQQEPTLTSQLAEACLQPQQKNLERSSRLQGLIDEEMATVDRPTVPDPAAAGAEEGDQSKAKKDQLTLATTILQQAVSEMQETNDLLVRLSKMDPPRADGPPVGEKRPPTDAKPDEGVLPKASPAVPDLESARSHTQKAIEHIEELRRLFFSLVEHLRDAAARQSNLNDETMEQVTELPDQSSDSMKQLGPLSNKQEQLKSIADQIVDALTQQSEQASAAVDQQAASGTGGQQPDPQAAAEAVEKLSQAAGLVKSSAEAMQKAIGDMEQLGAAGTGPDNPDEAAQTDTRDQIKEDLVQDQGDALQHLLQALALLDQQQNDGDSQQNQSQQNQNEQEQRQQQQQMSAQQLLQLIRDREAERRKNKQLPARTGAVDKDW